MSRISRPVMFLEMAAVAAKRSTCFRANVGALVVHNNSIVSLGYNGPPAGEEHCTGITCPGAEKGCVRAIHAEINAIGRIPESIVRGCDLYCTHSPCENCTATIIQAGRLAHFNEGLIQRLFFRDLYRINDHLAEFRNHWIPVYQVTPAGYCIDWFTKQLVDLA